MPDEQAQSLKVGQTDVGELVRFPDRGERRLKAVPQRKGTSPNQGHAATGRTREHLLPSEVDQLLAKARKSGRYAARNYAIVLLAYRHGLRVSEVADLRWTDINWQDASLLVRRKKNSKDFTHPLSGEELRALRKLQAGSKSAYCFTRPDGTPLDPGSISKMVKRLGEGLFGFPIHAHMLRHSCGYYLANKSIDTRTIQDYLGHRNIQNTERYTALAPGKFRGLWDG